MKEVEFKLGALNVGQTLILSVEPNKIVLQGRYTRDIQHETLSITTTKNHRLAADL